MIHYKFHRHEVTDDADQR